MSIESPQHPLQTYVLDCSIILPDFKPPNPTIFSDSFFDLRLHTPTGADIDNAIGRDEEQGPVIVFMCTEGVYEAGNEGRGHDDFPVGSSHLHLAKILKKMGLAYPVGR